VNAVIHPKWAGASSGETKVTGTFRPPLPASEFEDRRNIAILFRSTTIVVN
jgi:hypothetical protein